MPIIYFKNAFEMFLTPK